MVLKVVWFIIAGVLLLSHASARAESYLRVSKSGVIHYYFNSRPASPPKSPEMNTPSLPIVFPEPLTTPGPGEAETLIPETSPLSNRPARTDWQIVNLDGAKEPFRACTGYFVGLLSRLGYHGPPALPASNRELRGVDRHQDGPSIRGPQVVAPDAWVNFRKSVQEQLAQLGQMNHGPDGLMASHPFLYSFPVSGPFSFRDSWSDYRSGGRLHRAVDIFAREGTAVYAITAGVIHTLTTSPAGGITLLMQGQDGRGYGYMHLQGYAPGIAAGKAVRTGELVGYVGRTGLQTSPAHLHLQVYADHRLCRDELLNPYHFLVQLCRGVGVTDLHHHQVAYLQAPPLKVSKIRVYRRPGPKSRPGRSGRRIAKDSPVLVIRNF